MVDAFATDERTRQYLEKQKVVDIMEGLVEQLLVCQPADPVLGAITHLCKVCKIQPPPQCPKELKPRPIEEKKQEKKEEKKEEAKPKAVKVDAREEKLKKLQEEREAAKQKQMQEEDAAAALAASF